MFKMKLGAARKHAGFTQKEVAKAMGISNNTVVSWEKYATSPNVVQAQKLCKLYNIPYNNIIFLVDDSL